MIIIYIIYYLAPQGLDIIIYYIIYIIIFFRHREKNKVQYTSLGWEEAIPADQGSAPFSAVYRRFREGISNTF